MPRVRTLRKSLSWNLRVGGKGVGGCEESAAFATCWDPAVVVADAASWGSDGAAMPEDCRLVACWCATVAAMVDIWVPEREEKKREEDVETERRRDV